MKSDIVSLRFDFEQLVGVAPRPGQQEALTELLLALEKNDVVAFTAPPGFGKSLVVVAALKATTDTAAISTFTKQLQRQYRNACRWPVVMGRANYVCRRTGATAETAPCLVAGSQCSLDCEFRKARSRALASRRVITNHALLFVGLRFHDPITARRIIVLDECQRAADALSSICSLNDEEAAEASELAERRGIYNRPALLRSGLTGHEYSLVARYLAAKEMKREHPDWYDGGLNIVKPSAPLDLFEGHKVVLVSATVPYYLVPNAAIVRATPTVPVANRRLYVCPLGRMNRLNFQNFIPQITEFVIAAACSGGNSVVHAHNTDAAKLLYNQLRLQVPGPVFLAVGRDRRKSIEDFLRIPPGAGAVIIGPGIHEGVDFTNIRFQFIPKVLFPDITDCGSAEPHREAARRLAQAYGRGPRNAAQVVTTFVLDSMFYAIMEFLPDYVKEAVSRCTAEEMLKIISGGKA